MTTEVVADPTPDLFAAHAEKTNQILEQLVQQNAAARARENERPKEPAATETVYTREQLQGWVDEGKISVAQMVDYLVEHGTKKAAAELRRELKDTLDGERRRGTVEQRIAAFKANIPELSDKSSDEFKRAAEAFAELVADGHASDPDDPDSIKTELLALRIAFPEGSKPKPQQTIARERTSERQRSVESAGSGSGRGASKKETSGRWPSWMEDSRVEYYEEAIKRGRYKGMDDPLLKQELEILKKRKERAA